MADYYTEVAADSPSTWFKFEEASGTPVDTQAAVTVNSNSINTYRVTGPLTGMPTGNNYAVNMNGSHYVYFGNESALQPSSNFTIEFWFKSSASGSYMKLYRWRTYGVAATLTPFGKIEVFLYNNSGSTLTTYTTSLSYNDNTWRLVNIVRNGTALDLYVNGSHVTGATISSSANNYYGGGGAAVGRDGDSSAEHYTGDLAQFALYNSALSSTRIAAHWDARSTSPSVDTGSVLTAQVM